MGKDPVMFRSGNTVVAEASIAINRDKKNKDTGEYESFTTWVNIKAFGHNAEFMEKNVVKGNRIWVVGWLEESTWEDKNTKTQRSKLTVIVDKLQFGFQPRLASDYDKKKSYATQSSQTHADPQPQQGGYSGGEIPF